MTLLLDICPVIAPATPATTGAEIYARFEQEPDTMAIAIVAEDGRPLGLVERNTFLSAMAAQYGHALWANRSAMGLMNAQPLIVDGQVTVQEFCQSIQDERPASLLHGFIVTCGGRYAGVGAMVGLIKASAQYASDQAAEMQRLAETAQAALAARSRFLAVMSHEIRTPLNGVLGVAEILRSKAGVGEIGALADTIVNSGEVLLRLLNDALDLARSDASALELRDEPLLLSRLLEDSLALWTPQAELKGVELSGAFVGPQDLWTMGDPVRLRQVLNNLLSNALKFARERVDLRITAELGQTAAQVAVTITDDGPGIPEDRLQVVFEPFQQTEDGVRKGGAGLGLAVCRQIVERMEGRIGARNLTGGGAEFRMEAQLYPAAAPSFENASEAAPLPQESLHILIADDNPTNRIVASRICEMFGCSVECVEDGASAVDAVENRDFDLVLMDIMMPGMDGMQATRAIRQGPAPIAELPILALTANADPGDAVTYLGAGFDGVVAKPLKPETLLRAIEAALEARAQKAVAA